MGFRSGWSERGLLLGLIFIEMGPVEAVDKLGIQQRDERVAGPVRGGVWGMSRDLSWDS